MELKDRKVTDVTDEFNPDDWMTQEAIATQLGVPIDRVRDKVRAFGPANVIRTRINPLNRRQILVHKDDIDIIRRAIFG